MQVNIVLAEDGAIQDAFILANTEAEQRVCERALKRIIPALSPPAPWEVVGYIETGSSFEDKGPPRWRGSDPHAKGTLQEHRASQMVDF